MGRYFFHVYDGVNLLDQEGVEFPDWKEAQEEAIRYAGRVIADNAKTTKLGEDWIMQVTDETGLVLFHLDFHVSATPATMG